MRAAFGLMVAAIALNLTASCGETRLEDTALQVTLAAAGSEPVTTLDLRLSTNQGRQPETRTFLPPKYRRV